MEFKYDGREDVIVSEQDRHRKKYRTPKRDIAVRVYTLNQESKYLLVKNIPALGATKELLKLFALYGPIEEYRILDDYDTLEEYTEVYWIKYSKIVQAQEAKRKMDNFPFLGNLLEVSYAPQFESISDVTEKINERKKMILERVLEPNYYNTGKNTGSKIVPAISISQINPTIFPFIPPNSSSTIPSPTITTSSAPITTATATTSMNKTIENIRNKLNKSYNKDNVNNKKRKM